MRIKKDSEIYDALLDAVFKIFEQEIALEDPVETTDAMVKSINKYLKD